MNPELAALLTLARWMSSDQRAIVADGFRATQPLGSLLVATCHRVELYGIETELAPLTAGLSGVQMLRGSDAARQLIALAVGRDSSVIGEDQILHQLRIAARRARESGVLSPSLDRLLDVSLRAGRRARSWLPANRPTLVDVAIDRVAGPHRIRNARVHVVGAGAMGRAAAATLLSRGARVTVGSRTTESAQSLADRFGIPHTPFVPAQGQLAELSGVVIALAGVWPVPRAAAEAIVNSGAWVVDLSSPSALAPGVGSLLSRRLTPIDDLLASPDHDGSTARVIERLDALVDETVAAYEQWLTDERHRATAAALANRAHTAQSVELERLWQRLPTLDETQRAEVERALEHLTKRLLRDPLEQIRHDRDGRHARAARELFRL